ncbi:hypothetical protein EVA_02507 [gut metagenome]|uniref:Uncharacterized protein n=1 Tax=gut metagenome TaxID=749906 RepID=J9H0Z3_9ZZZZ
METGKLPLREDQVFTLYHTFYPTVAGGSAGALHIGFFSVDGEEHIAFERFSHAGDAFDVVELFFYPFGKDY